MPIETRHISGSALVRQMRRQIRRYELRYEVPSATMRARVAAGELRETAEIGRWLQLVTVLQRFQSDEPQGFSTIRTKRGGP